MGMYYLHMMRINEIVKERNSHMVLEPMTRLRNCRLAWFDRQIWREGRCWEVPYHLS